MVDKDLARVIDILEQIEDLNKMIKLHKKKSDSSMLTQYQEMKNKFLEELKVILSDYGIEVLIKGKG